MPRHEGPGFRGAGNRADDQFGDQYRLLARSGRGIALEVAANSIDLAGQQAYRACCRRLLGAHDTDFPRLKRHPSSSSCTRDGHVLVRSVDLAGVIPTSELFSTGVTRRRAGDMSAAEQT